MRLWLMALLQFGQNDVCEEFTMGLLGKSATILKTVVDLTKANVLVSFDWAMEDLDYPLKRILTILNRLDILLAEIHGGQ